MIKIGIDNKWIQTNLGKDALLQIKTLADSFTKYSMIYLINYYGGNCIRTPEQLMQVIVVAVEHRKDFDRSAQSGARFNPLNIKQIVQRLRNDDSDDSAWGKSAQGANLSNWIELPY